jgi:hypothetical protein
MIKKNYLMKKIEEEKVLKFQIMKTKAAYIITRIFLALKNRLIIMKMNTII